MNEKTNPVILEEFESLIWLFGASKWTAKIGWD